MFALEEAVDSDSIPSRLKSMPEKMILAATSATKGTVWRISRKIRSLWLRKRLVTGFPHLQVMG